MFFKKGIGAKRIYKEFSNKKSAVSSVKDLLRKTDKTNSTERKIGSGRPRTDRTARSACIAELIHNQEDNPGSSKSPYRRFAAMFDRSSNVTCGVKCFDAGKSTCCLILIIESAAERYGVEDFTGMVWFSGEKITRRTL